MFLGVHPAVGRMNPLTLITWKKDGNGYLITYLCFLTSAVGEDKPLTGIVL